MSDSSRDRFRLNLINLLNAHAVHQNDLAEACGHVPSWVSQVLLGRRMPDLDDVDRIAAFLQCAVSDLFLPVAPPPETPLMDTASHAAVSGQLPPARPLSPRQVIDRLWDDNARLRATVDDTLDCLRPLVTFLENQARESPFKCAGRDAIEAVLRTHDHAKPRRRRRHRDAA